MVEIQTNVVFAESNAYSVIEYDIDVTPVFQQDKELTFPSSHIGVEMYAAGKTEGGDYSLSNRKIITNRDQQFIARFKNIVLTKFDDETFNREKAACMLGMSERQLNRKLSVLKSGNFNKYLRELRLREALKLLNTGLQVSQIADRVGFANATYFSTCFKKAYGMTVKAYERKMLTGSN